MTYHSLAVAAHSRMSHKLALMQSSTNSLKYTLQIMTCWIAYCVVNIANQPTHYNSYQLFKFLQGNQVCGHRQYGFRKRTSMPITGSGKSGNVTSTGTW